jgi:hypothetical protein
LKAKWIADFDTYLGGDFEKAVKKMEKRLDEKVSTLKLIISGLSIRVGGMKGPIVDGELPKRKDFGKQIATQLVIIVYRLTEKHSVLLTLENLTN